MNRQGNVITKKKRKERLYDKILSLLTHPTNDIVHFNRASSSFKVTQMISGKPKVKTVSGLTKKLKDVFWSDYIYRRPKYSKGTGVSTPLAGIKRGHTVHSQLEDYFNQTKNDFMIKYDIKDGKQPNLEQYTMKVISYLSAQKLKPLRGEFTVYDRNLNIATKIDMLCVDKYDRIVAIELKTGMDDYFFIGNAALKSNVLSKYVNNPMNQAFLQLLISCVMLEKNYDIHIDNLWIIQVKQDGINAYAVPEEMIKDKDIIYEYFLNNKK